jgi:acyl carrier protein
MIIDQDKGDNYFMTLEEKVIEIVMKHLKVTKEECKPEASFIEDLGADSIDLVEMITAMEESFEIKITDSELEKIRTIQDAIDFLKSKSIQ